MSVEKIGVHDHVLTFFDLPPEPGEAYRASVDDDGGAVVEREEARPMTRPIRSMIAALCKQNADLYEENVDLRDLCRDLYAFLASWSSRVPCVDSCRHFDAKDGCMVTGMCWFASKLKAMGIEART